MIVRLLVLLCAVSVVFAYSPQPKVITKAETDFDAVIAKAETDEAKVAAAKEFLEMYPDNILLGRSAQNVLNRKSDTPPDWYKARMEASPTTANRYLWARASQDSEVMTEQAAWIMENDPENFWGYYLAATTEWDKEAPDMDKVTHYFEQAVAKDPAQYTGYLWLGYAYEEADKPEQALEVFKAAEVVDPEDSSPKQAMLGLYAQLRNADKYFELVTPMLPVNAVTAELAVAKAEEESKPVGFSGETTVLEFFTYW
jgi:tetratricopeptide (TPR) repeat protein